MAGLSVLRPAFQFSNIARIAAASFAAFPLEELSG
jgi:hypothetical protein